MDKNDYFLISAIVSVISVAVTVIGWIVTNRANNKNSREILKAQEINKSIDDLLATLSDNYDSILKELSNETYDIGYYARINYVERIRILANALRETDGYKNELSQSELNTLIISLRKISTNDENFSEENKISTPSRAISIQNKFIQKFSKNLT